MVDLDRARRRLEIALGHRVREGNEVTRLRNGVEIFPAMEEAIRDATRTIDFLTFVYWTGEPARIIGHALADRARHGVRVRMVLDAFGARHMDEELLDDLRGAGVHLHWFRDVLDDADTLDANHRTHRKLLVVDNAVGFVGGVGIAEEWSGDARNEHEWRDDHFRLRGPVVESLRAAFLDDWTDSGHPLFAADEDLGTPEPCGDVPVVAIRSESERGFTDVALAKRLLLGEAESTVRLTTAYFSPNETMVTWLVDAAARGVDVRVLMPGQHTDKRIPQVAGESAYPELLAAGVRVWRYERTMLHAKVLTIDGRVANVGSANFNLRSMRQDEELDVVVFDEELTGVLDRDFDDDVRAAVEVTEEDWAPGLVQRVQEAAVGLIDRWV